VQTPIEKHKANNRAFEPNQNVEDYFDVASLRPLKSEALNPKQIQIGEIRNSKLNFGTTQN
jgi:hypothetical protein